MVIFAINKSRDKRSAIILLLPGKGINMIVLFLASC